MTDTEPLGPVIDRVVDAFLRRHRRKAYAAFVRARPRTMEEAFERYVPFWAFLDALRDPGVGTGIRRDYLRAAATLRLDERLIPPARPDPPTFALLLWPIVLVGLIRLWLRLKLVSGHGAIPAPPFRQVVAAGPWRRKRSGSQLAAPATASPDPRTKHDAALRMIELLVERRPDLMRELAAAMLDPARGADDDDRVVYEVHPKLVAFWEEEGFPYEKQPLWLFHTLQKVCLMIALGYGSPEAERATSIPNRRKQP